MRHCGGAEQPALLSDLVVRILLELGRAQFYALIELASVELTAKRAKLCDARTRVPDIYHAREIT